ncbi:MAG: hypothetical protein AAF677_05385 [Pseudomonadota bacterium]
MPRSRPSVPAWRAALLLVSGALIGGVAALPTATAQPLEGPNSCEFAFDGECDERLGFCDAGTDTWDCRRTGAPPGPDACASARNGRCEEDGSGGGVCLPFTDTTDCRAAGFDQALVFFGRDDRRWVRPDRAPYSMIGRLQDRRERYYCTAALVGPSAALTAAHCLFDPDDVAGDLVPPRRFVSGVHGQDSGPETAVVGWYHPPEFDALRIDPDADTDRHDWAILFLDEPLGEKLGYLAIEPLAEAVRQSLLTPRAPVLMQAGYNADAGAFMAAHDNCAVVQLFEDRTLGHECDTLPGASGSPILTEAADGGFAIVAMDVSVYVSAEIGKPNINVAVDAAAFAEAVQRYALPRRGAVRPRPRVKPVQAGE